MSTVGGFQGLEIIDMDVNGLRIDIRNKGDYILDKFETINSQIFYIWRQRNPEIVRNSENQRRADTNMFENSVRFREIPANNSNTEPLDTPKHMLSVRSTASVESTDGLESSGKGVESKAPKTTCEKIWDFIKWLFSCFCRSSDCYDCEDNN